MSDARKSNDVFHANPALSQHMAKINEMSGGVSPVTDNVETDTFANVLSKDFGVQLPNERVPLPSRGLVYDVNSALHKVEQVDIKTMTAREEDILMNQALLKKGTVVTELLRSCLVDKRINPGELVVGDRNALMVAVRITGYGADYEAEVSCSECGQSAKTTFDLSSLPLKELEVEPVVPYQNLFSYTLPRFNLPVQFRLLTGRVEEEIAVTQERQKKANVGGDNAVTLQLQHAIVSVNGVTDRTKLANFVKSIPASDSAALRKYIRDIEPGITMKQERTCPHCEHVEEVTIPMGVSFLWPNVKR